MAQANEVADDRADRRAATAPGWQARAATDGAYTSDFLGDVRRLLLQVAIDQEKAGQLVLADEFELVGELPLGFGAQVGVGPIGRIAFVKLARAEGGQDVVG